MDAAEPRIAVLEERLRRYPAERYPVQHATAQFHLGGELANAGRTDEAVAALETAARLFAAARLDREHAKALNALGAAYRLDGRLADAKRALSDAAGAFQQLGSELELGAAEFNLALVVRELGDSRAARERLERAQALLDPRRVPAQAAAVARELGTLLAETGAEGAADALESAVSLAERGDDLTGRAAAANTLGLVLLTEGRVDEAVAALRTAVASSPRTLRPGDYALAKANLALALERAGEFERARLAALQARTVPGTAAPVRVQAEAVLTRLGGRPDVAALVAAEPQDERAPLLRDEVARWLDSGDNVLSKEAAAWIADVRGRDDAGELWAALVGVLVELPPEQLERIAHALAGAAPELRSAALRLRGPQAERLDGVFAVAQDSEWRSPAT